MDNRTLEQKKQYIKDSLGGFVVSGATANTINAAYTYTQERERKIANVLEEIEWLIDCGLRAQPAPLRILERENAALDELLKGWKGAGK